MSPAKRILDLLVLCFSLPIVLPVFSFISISIFLLMGRPILFKQKRPGYKGRPFNLLKFRTMNNKRNSNGQLLPDRKRLTKLGRLLRTTSLDELPEILNVINREMSLVGPRPLLLRYLRRYSSDQARRHDMIPGLTGWAQINGRNALSWEEKFKLDVWYVDNWSIWLDIRIIIKTVDKVLRREGINQSGEETMSEFVGSLHSKPKESSPC
jgi:sugar transferase EpsL